MKQNYKIMFLDLFVEKNVNNGPIVHLFCKIAKFVKIFQVPNSKSVLIPKR